MRVSTKKVVLCSVLSLLLGTAAVSNVSQAGGKAEASAPPESTVTAPQDRQAEPIAPAAGVKVEVTEASFKCLHEMTKTGKMYVDNLLGDLDGTLAVANNLSGTYPPGSVVQLLPNEVMVKLEKGANPATNDWEFFVLDGSKIKQRGFETVGNRLGSCISCHKQASAPQADMICAAGHACPPVVFPGISNTDVLISALQKMDQRCPRPDLLTDEEKPLLKQFMDMLAAAAAGGGQ